MAETTEKSRRRFLQATGGLAAGVALAGCLDDDAEIEEGDDIDLGDDSDDSDTSDDSEPAAADGDDILRMINPTMDNMDTIASTFAATGTVLTQVHDTLTYEPNGEITIEGLLAEDYDVSDDFLTYTFYLKEGVQFHHDYGEMTADDFAYSWERLAGSPNTRRAERILDDFLGVAHEKDADGDYVPGSLEIEAVDDYTFEFTLGAPYHSVPELITYRAFAPLPEGLVGDIDGYDGDIEYEELQSGYSPGTGPFVLEEWISDQECEVSAFDDYHGDGPHVDGIHWHIMEDGNAQYNFSMNKNVDVLEIPTAQFDPDLLTIEEEHEELGREVGTYGPMRNDEVANYMRVEAFSTGHFTFNTNQIIKEARQAMAYVMDHEQISEDIFKSRTAPGYMYTPPALFPGGPEAYWEMVEEEYPYGPGSMIDEARVTMEEAGYGEDSVYEFEFYITPGEADHQFLGQIRDQLTAAHIDMSIEEAPFSTIISQAGNAAIEGGWNSGWSMSLNEPSNILQLTDPWGTDPDNPQSTIIIDWGDSEGGEWAEELWETIESHPEPTEEHEEVRNEAYKDLERANWMELPYLNYEHRVDDRLWYDWLDIPLFGPGSGQKFNEVRLGERN